MKKIEWVPVKEQNLTARLVRIHMKKGESMGLFDDNEKDGKTIQVIPTKQVTYDSDGFLYGRATGGFGCRPKIMGSAIFVEEISSDLNEVLSGEAHHSARWERYYESLEVAEE